MTMKASMPGTARALPETIPGVCAEICRRDPDRISMQIKQGDVYQQYTYGQVVQQVERLSTALVRRGLRQGDRAAIVAENRPEWAIAYLGIVAAGGTAVPLDIQMSSGEIATLLAESQSRVLFASGRTWPLLKDLSSKPILVSLDPTAGPGDFALHELLAQEAGGVVETAKVQPDDVASLLYTSGTTGKPKGVLLTHRNLASNAQALVKSGLAGADDNFLAILPLHHAYAFMVAFLVPLLLGARVTFLHTLKAPELLQCLREARITLLVGVPQIFAMFRRTIFEEIGRRPPLIRPGIYFLLFLSSFMRRLSGLNLGKAVFATVHRRFGESLRLLCSGGARLDPQVARDLFRLGFTLLEGYGLTETAPVVTFNPLARPKIGSVGIPLTGVEVRIADADAAGVGEVVVRGSNVMKGYDRNPEATAEAIRNGWFHTGDLGYLDRDGYLFLTGRIKELIVTAGGKNIYPEELEAQYQASPAIAELCLVGTEPTGMGGEGLHAVVVPDFEYLKTHRIGDVRQQIKDELQRIGLILPPYKRIMGLSIVKEPLPRTRLGKIQRHLVAAVLADVDKQRERKPPLSEADRALLATGIARGVLAAITALVPGRKEIGLEDHLELDLGLDSLRRVEFVVALEERFGPLPHTFAGEVGTVRDVLERVTALVQGAMPGAPGHRSWGEILRLPPPAALTDALLGPSPLHHRIVAACARAILGAILRVVFRLRVMGLASLPRDEAFILAPNHVSHVDPFAVIVAVPPAVFARLCTLGWQIYFRGPITAWLGRVSRVIPVGVDAPLVTTLRAAAAVLRRGQSLLIFPEGERAWDGRLQPFKKGIGVLACEMGVPVIPAWIEGTFEVLPVGALWPRLHPIAIRFGEKVMITPDMIERWRGDGLDPHEASTQLVREAVLSLARAGGEE